MYNRNRSHFAVCVCVCTLISHGGWNVSFVPRLQIMEPSLFLPCFDVIHKLPKYTCTAKGNNQLFHFLPTISHFPPFKNHLWQTCMFSWLACFIWYWQSEEKTNTDHYHEWKIGWQTHRLFRPAQAVTNYFSLPKWEIINYLLLFSKRSLMIILFLKLGKQIGERMPKKNWCSVNGKRRREQKQKALLHSPRYKVISLK